MKNTTDPVFNDILKIVSSISGTDFTKYKPSTLERRINKRIQLTGKDSAEEYLRFLEENNDEALALFKEILIGVTGFFRDKDAFEAIKKCLQEIIINKNVGDHLRIWSVGCATGEEVYSIGILLNEMLEESDKKLRVQIFGTDVDERSVSKAREGIFAERKFKDMNAGLREKYFHKTDAEHYVIKKSVKSRILFTKHDVTSDPPFVKQDLVICRNLLIYFDAKLQKEVLAILHYALQQDGYLFLGKSESIGNLNNLFHTINNKLKIYKKNNTVQSQIKAFPKFKFTHTYPSFSREKSNAEEGSLTDLIKNILYNSYEHPFAIVNENLEIEEVHGSLRLYLDVKGSLTNKNIQDMVNPELKSELRSLFFKVNKTGLQARSNVISFELFDQQHFVKLIVKPAIDPKLSQQYYVIVFENIETANPELFDPEETEDKALLRIAELEQELNIAREQLETYTEELDSSHQELQLLNEELQSTNEELKSSNEELETANEELQSSNDELLSSNMELQRVNDELIDKEGKLQIVNYLWDSIFENSPETICLLDRDWNIKNINHFRNKSEALGVDKYTLIGSSILEYFNEADKAVIKDALNSVNKQHSTSARAHGKLTSSQYEFKFIALKENNQFSGVIAFINDITEQQHYQEMLYFLNQSSRELLGTLDLDKSIKNISQLIVPRLADWFTIDILNDQNQLELLSVAHKDPDKVKWARQYREANPPDMNAPTGTPNVIRTGKSEYIPLITDDLLVASAKNEEQLELMRNIGFHSAMTVPLRIKNKSIGAINFISTIDSNRQYNQNDVLLAEEFAKLVSLSLENSNLYNAAQDEIKERKQAQQALEKSEAQLKIITNGLPVAVTYFDKNYKYIFANDTYSKFVGVPKEEIVGKEIKDILQKDVFDILKKYIDKGIKGETVHFQQELPYVYQGKRYVDVQYIPDFDPDGKVRGVVVLINDITEQRQHELDLEQSELKSRLIIEALPQIAWTADSNGYITFYNQRWYEYTGLSVEESLKNNSQIVMHPDQRKEVMKIWEKSIKTGKPFHYEGKLLQKSTGVYRWHLINALPIRDTDGNVMMWVGTSTDIEEQKQLNEKKDEFISIASHELKTPLATIKAYIQLLLKELNDQKDDDLLLTYADKANNYTKVLNDLISDLLDISRIQAGKLELIFNNFYFDELIDQSIEDFKLSFPDYHIKIDGNGHYKVMGDKVRLEQVIQNFLSNAVKYAPNSINIDVEVHKTDDHLQLDIKDYGKGISNENIKKIFEKYYRVEESDNHSGLGVGLYICSEIIDKHGGRIWASSEEGKGTTFSFTIPIKEIAADERQSKKNKVIEQ